MNFGWYNSSRSSKPNLCRESGPWAIKVLVVHGGISMLVFLAAEALEFTVVQRSKKNNPLLLLEESFQGWDGRGQAKTRSLLGNSHPLLGFVGFPWHWVRASETLTFRPWARWAFQPPLGRSATGRDSRARAGVGAIPHSSWSLTSAILYEKWQGK